MRKQSIPRNRSLFAKRTIRMEHRERSGTGFGCWTGNEVALLLTAEEEVIPTEVTVEFVRICKKVRYISPLCNTLN